jgi:diacylglycerol kinase family enzyme
VQTRGRGHIHVANDGEVFTATAPLHYRIRPKALRVVVPTSQIEAT